MKTKEKTVELLLLEQILKTLEEIKAAVTPTPEPAVLNAIRFGHGRYGSPTTR